MELRWQNLAVLGSGGQTISVFFGEAGSLGEEALRSVAVREPGQLGR